MLGRGQRHVLLLLGSVLVVCPWSSVQSYSRHAYDSTACNRPCRAGTYEVMPCSDTHPKLCRGKCALYSFVYSLCILYVLFVYSLFILYASFMYSVCILCVFGVYFCILCIQCILWLY